MIPGSVPVVVSGTTYSLDSSGTTMVVNGIISPLPNLEETHRQVLPVLSIGSQRLTANAASEYTMEGETFSPTENAVVVSGSTYSLAIQEPATILNGVTSTLSGYQQINSAFWPMLSIKSTPLTVHAASEYILDGHTQSPGGSPISVSGTTYSLVPQASALVIDGTTSKFPEKEEEKLTSGAVIKLGSQYLTADSALRYNFGSKTLAAGSTPIVVSGTTYSLAAQASALIMSPEATLLPQIKIGSQYLTPGSTFGYILGSETLMPGATPIVFFGTTYSLAPQASALVINGVTSILHEQTTSLLRSTSSSSQIQYGLGDQTLSPGAPAITISGFAISLAASGSTIVINGTAFPFPTGTTPSLTIGSRLLVATPASRPNVSGPTSKIGAAAGTASNGNTWIMPSATNVVTGSTNSSLSTATLIKSGDESPGSVLTGKAGRGGFGLAQMLGVLFVSLGLALL